MGLKGINPFEQHVEKIVVGVSGAALLAVLAAQFMGSSSTVKVGKGAPVAPAEAYKPVEQEAQRIAAQLDSGDPQLPEAPRTEALAAFEARLTEPVASAPLKVALGPATPVSGLTLGTEKAVDTPLAELRVPAPAEPVAHAFRSTVSPFEWFSVEELRGYLPKQQPFDKAAVSIETTFDGTALKQALTADPDGDEGPVRPLPLSWWRDGVEIVGVEMEREQLGPDGKWGSSTIVKNMPGRPNLIAEVQSSLKSIGDVTPFLSRVRTAVEQVQRPAYYETIAGPKWMPPLDASASEADGAAQGPEALVRRVADLDARIAKLNEQIAPLPKEPPVRDPKAPRQAQPEGEGRRGGPPAGRPGSGGGGEEERRRGYAQYQALNRQLATAQNQRASAVEQLAKAGLGPDGQPATATGSLAAGPVSKPLLEDPAVRVWNHDVTVEPGATYRYRTRIVVNNPMFGRQPYLLEAQKSLGDVQLARGEWSEWSQPVPVDNDRYFFIVSANEQDQVGGKRATAELYQFYYGYWRKGAVNVEPGDALVAEAKLPAELPIYDLSKLAALPQAQTPVDPRRGVEETVEETVHRPGRRPVPAEVAAPPAAKDVVPEGVTFGPAKMAVGVDALFMDVAPLPSAADRRLATNREQLQAFLRDAAGQIITRIPDHERAKPAYQRVTQSAKAGETQGKPVVKPVNRPELPPPPSRDPREGGGRPIPGGGGGGGG